MKGNPLFRLILILTTLFVVLWPVCRLTLHSSSNRTAPLETISSGDYSPTKPEPAPTNSTTPTLRATILLHGAPAPIRCSVSQGGMRLLTEKNLIAPGEYRAAVQIRKGEDLVVDATWEADEPHAVRVEVLVHGYQAPLEKSFWAERNLLDAFPIPESFLK